MPKSKVSAGLLMYRYLGGKLELLLAHPGGPFFQNKDEGAWSLPKGEFIPEEDPLAAAQREFTEETGLTVSGPFIALTPIKQKGGKTVYAWAFEGNCDPKEIISNTFSIEWPPRSGQHAEFPEIDRAEFFGVQLAKQKINLAQSALIDELEMILNAAAEWK